MNEHRTSTLEDGDVERSDPSRKFSFIRAAAGFVLEDPPEGGVFTGPATEPAPPRIETVHPVDLPPMVVRKPPPTPLAHRLMVVALIPFVLVAVAGLIVINRPSPRRQQPAPAPTAATVPVAEAPIEVAPPTEVAATTPPVLFTPAPAVPVTRAPRRAPVAQTTVPPATTPTTEPPPTTTPTTEPPPTTTPTTEPPPTTTPTTEPPPTTTPTTQPPSTTTPTTQPPSTGQ